MERSDTALRGQGRTRRVQQRAAEFATVRERPAAFQTAQADLAQQMDHLLSATSPRHGSRYPRRGSIGPTIRQAARYCAGQPSTRISTACSASSRSRAGCDRGVDRLTAGLQVTSGSPALCRWLQANRGPQRDSSPPGRDTVRCGCARRMQSTECATVTLVAQFGRQRRTDAVHPGGIGIFRECSAHPTTSSPQSGRRFQCAAPIAVDAAARGDARPPELNRPLVIGDRRARPHRREAQTPCMSAELAGRLTRRIVGSRSTARGIDGQRLDSCRSRPCGNRFREP